MSNENETKNSGSNGMQQENEQESKQDASTSNPQQVDALTVDLKSESDSEAMADQQNGSKSSVSILEPEDKAPSLAEVALPKREEWDTNAIMLERLHRDFVVERTQTVARLVEAVLKRDPPQVLITITCDGRSMTMLKKAQEVARGVYDFAHEAKEMSAGAVWAGVHEFAHDEAPGVVTLQLILMLAVRVKPLEDATPVVDIVAESSDVAPAQN